MNSMPRAQPIRARLRSTEQFRLAYREGRRAANDFFTVHARWNGLSQSRLGIAVSSRIGTSVERNRVRRRMREAVRSLTDIPVGLDIVIVAKGAVMDAPFADIRNSAQGVILQLAEDIT